MSDLKRLSAEPESEFELRILRAGRVEPSLESKERAFLLASSVVASSAILSSGTAGGSAASGGLKVGWMAKLPWLVVLALAGVGVWLGIRATRGGAPDARPARALAVAQTASADSSIPTPNAPEAVHPDAPNASATVPSAAPPRRRTQETTSGAPSLHARKEGTAAVASDLTAELAVLDGVRRAMEADDLHRARSMLDGYEERFPRGTMAAEATVLRIDLLMRIGDRSSATRLADTFLATHPDSLYVSRVKSLLAGSNP